MARHVWRLLTDEQGLLTGSAARGPIPVIFFTRAGMSSEDVSITSSAPIAFSSSKYALLRTWWIVISGHIPWAKVDSMKCRGHMHCTETLCSIGGDAAPV